MDRARRLILVGALALIVVAGVTAYVVLRPPASGGSTAGSNPLEPTEIGLVPSANTRSACIVGTPGTPRPTLPLANGTLQANTYSVPNGTVGHVGMCYRAESDSLFSYVNWTHVGPAGGWFSYPQVAYGVNDYAGAFTTYTNQSPAWQLPQTVASAVNRSLWVTASYEIDPPPASDVDGYDLSFDNFFSAGLPPTLEVAPFVEVEIFLAHNISYPFHWAPWTTETLVNSTVVDEPWDVAYYCHGADNSSNGNISFDFSFGGQTSAGLRQGTLGVNLSAILGKVESMMPTASCWTGPTSDFSKFYLGEQDLGSEDGALGGSSFDYNWTVGNYCIHTLVQSSSPAAVECSSNATNGSPASIRMGSDRPDVRSVPGPTPDPPVWGEVARWIEPKCLG